MALHLLAEADGSERENDQNCEALSFRDVVRAGGHGCDHIRKMLPAGLRAMGKLGVLKSSQTHREEAICRASDHQIAGNTLGTG